MQLVSLLCEGLFPDFVNRIFSMFYLTRSLINPIMYSLRMPLHCILQEPKNKLKVPHWRSKNLAAIKIELARNTFKTVHSALFKKGPFYRSVSTHCPFVFVVCSGLYIHNFIKNYAHAD